jgi:type VI secretion system Hcp family effector
MSPARMCRWLAAALILAAQPAVAAYSAWLEIDGMPGEATEVNHRDWIDVAGFEIAGRLNEVGGFSIRKNLDRASPKLFLSCAQGTVHRDVTLDLRKVTYQGADTGYLRLQLSDVIFTGQETSGSDSADRPEETVTLSFSKVVYIYLDGKQTGGTIYYDNSTRSGGTGTGGGGGTDPDPDSDNDGLPDAWETANGLTVGVNDADLDLDGDGFTNYEEYQLGTDPRSGASFFKATLIPNAISPGNHQLTWNSVAGKAYIIEWSPDLVTKFTTLRNVTATGAATTETVSHAGTLGFYRVRPAP